LNQGHIQAAPLVFCTHCQDISSKCGKDGINSVDETLPHLEYSMHNLSMYIDKNNEDLGYGIKGDARACAKLPPSQWQNGYRMLLESPTHTQWFLLTASSWTSP